MAPSALLSTWLDDRLLDFELFESYAAFFVKETALCLACQPAEVL